MAEITVGAVVLGIINALSQEGVRAEGAIFRATASRIKKFSKELEEIKSGFESIKSLLRASNMAEEEDPDVVGGWVNGMRMTAHEVEDIVDEYRYFLNGSLAGRRKAFFHDVKRISFISDLAQRLEEAKKKVDGYCTNKNDLALHMLKRRAEYNGPATVNCSRSWISCHRPSSGSQYPDVDQSPLGTAENEMLLLKWMLGEQEGNDVSAAEPRSWQDAVIVVVGMSGLGKTTLVSKVYNNAKVHRRFNRRAWVSVSNVCAVESLLAVILEQLLNCKLERHAKEGKEWLLKQMRTALQGNRCVIVLDDAPEISRIDLFRELLGTLYSYALGIRILITTRYQRVASLLANEGRILQPPFLEHEQAWALFCKTAFVDGVCPKNLEPYALEMVQKCGGLPLALGAVGSMMFTKGTDSVIWERNLVTLSYEAGGQPVRGDPYNIMGRLISRKLLIRLWAAEGFVECREGMTPEEVAEEYLRDLVSRSMIQVVKWNEFGRVRACKLHDMIREMALRVIKRQKLFTIQQSSQRLECSSIRRLSAHRLYKEAVPLNADFNRLRSLLVFDNVDASVSDCLKIFIDTLKLLKILDLRGVPIESIPKPVFDLFNLQYLSVRDTNIKEFPRDIKRLQSLQTLDVWNTKVVKLPYHVYKLQKLRHLICGPMALKLTYKKLTITKKYKHGIWNLINLQTLKIIDSDDQIASCLGNLKQLRTLFISNVSQVQENSLCGSISGLTNLMGLTIKTADGVDLRLLNVHPPPHLQKLEIRGKLRGVPNWLHRLDSLKQLILFDSELQKCPLDSICDLSSLASLCLSNACTDSQLNFKPQRFSHLKILYLKDMPVTNIVIDEGSLPTLQKLYICCCNKLETAPRISHLQSSLKEVCLQEPTRQLKEGVERICHSMPSVVLMQN